METIKTAVKAPIMGPMDEKYLRPPQLIASSAAIIDIIKNMVAKM
jgi:hypothetical protein